MPGACTKINDSKDLLCLKKKRSGYAQKSCFQMLFLVKFLTATPMLYLRICCSLIDLKNGMHGMLDLSKMMRLSIFTKQPVAGF